MKSVVLLVCCMIVASVADDGEFENDAITVHFTPKDSADAATIKKIDFYHLNKGFLYEATKFQKKGKLIEGPRGERNKFHPTIINDEMDIKITLVRPFFQIQGHSNLTLDAVSELDEGSLVSNFTFTFPNYTLESEVNITGKHKGQEVNEEELNLIVVWDYVKLKITVNGKSKVQTPLYSNVEISFKYGNLSGQVEDSKVMEKIKNEELLKAVDKTTREIMNEEFRKVPFLLLFNRDIEKMVKEGVF